MRKKAQLAVLLSGLFLSILLAACGDTPTATTAALATTARATTAASATASVATTAASTTAASVATTAAPATTGELTVYAAASLTDAFNEMKTEIEKANPGLKITYSFAGSNALRNQLEQGAKADVFASADQVQMDTALKSGLVADKGTEFVRNRLVVIVPKNNTAKIEKLQDLAKPGLKFVTAQKDVPVGNYTLQALEKMSKDAAFGSDYQSKVEANIVSREANVRQVVSKVQLGEADAAVVYLSDVTPKIAPELQTFDIPDAFNTIAVYPIAPLKATANPSGAKVFIDYVLGEKGQMILKKNNFVPIKP
jgi:molybdate transport system substrate-binding protein